MTLNELIKIVNELATDPENLDLKIYFDDGIGCFDINHANVCQMGDDIDDESTEDGIVLSK